MTQQQQKHNKKKSTAANEVSHGAGVQQVGACLRDRGTVTRVSASVVHGGEGCGCTRLEVWRVRVGSSRQWPLRLLLTTAVVTQAAQGKPTAAGRERLTWQPPAPQAEMRWLVSSWQHPTGWFRHIQSRNRCSQCHRSHTQRRSLLHHKHKPLGRPATGKTRYGPPTD